MTIMEELTLKEVYDLSIRKWEFLIENPEKEEEIEEMEEFKNLQANCGYCEYYREQRHGGCWKCPLGNKHDGSEAPHCIFPGHTYNKWKQNQTEENAKKVLDLIIKTKPI